MPTTGPLVGAVSRIAEGNGCTPGQVALAWATIPVQGARYADAAEARTNR